MSTVLDLSLGAIEVGVMISTMLYGINCVQVYMYYIRDKPKDPWYIQALVPLVWVIDTLHTCFMIKYLYYTTVIRYGDVSAIGEASWALNTSAFFDGLAGALVQGFFAHRIYVLSRRWPLTIISWIGSLAVVITDTSVMAIAQATQYDLATFESKYRWAIITGLVLQLFVDLVNTTSLCVLLRVERTGFQNTDGILNKLFVWTIQTGIITSIAAILMVAFSVGLPNSALWVSISIFYSKLYSNSLMAALNGRQSLRVLDKHDANQSATFASAFEISAPQQRSRDLTETELGSLPAGKGSFGSYRRNGPFDDSFA